MVNSLVMRKHEGLEHRLESQMELPHEAADSVTFDEIQALLKERTRLETRRGNHLSIEQERTLSQAIEKGRAAAEWLENGSTEFDEDERKELEQWSVVRTRAVQEFIDSNQGFLRSRIRRYEGRGVPLEDLLQEGNAGLIIAANKFDWRRGRRFTTYAGWWIQQSLQTAMMQSDTIQLPRDIVRLRSQVLAYMSEHSETGLSNAMEHFDFDDDTRDKVMGAMAVMGLTSLNQKKQTGDSEGSELQEFIADTSGGDRVTGMEAATDMLELLSDRQRDAVTLYYGFDRDDPRTLVETAEIMGTSEATVRNILGAANDIFEKEKQRLRTKREVRDEIKTRQTEHKPEVNAELVNRLHDEKRYGAQQIAEMLECDLDEVQNLLR